MKDERAGVVTKEVVGCPRCIPFWQMMVVSIKKAKGVKKMPFAAIRHDEYKNVLLNNKCLWYLMNRI